MKPRLIFLKNALVLLLLLCAAVTSQAYAQATAPRSLPSRGALDIGAVSHPGAFVEEDTTVRIWSWGSDIWGRHDQFHYVWYDLPGDGEMTARLESQDATDGWAKAGIMLRETTYDNAANVFLALTPQHGARMQWRSATNVLTVETAGPRVAAPTWLKLVRSKNVITGAISANGTAWTTIRSVTVAMSATARLVWPSPHITIVCATAPSLPMWP